MTEALDRAIEAVRALPAAARDEIAHAMLARAARAGAKRMISVHEYELRRGTDRDAFEHAVRSAEADGVLRLPGLDAHHVALGRKGVRLGEYAAVWIYGSRAAWENLWGPPDDPHPPADYPPNWRVWEREILAPFLASDPDALRFTAYEEI